MPDNTTPEGQAANAAAYAKQRPAALRLLDLFAATDPADCKHPKYKRLAPGLEVCEVCRMAKVTGAAVEAEEPAEYW